MWCKIIIYTFSEGAEIRTSLEIIYFWCLVGLYEDLSQYNFKIGVI